MPVPPSCAETDAWLALTLTPGISAQVTRSLLQRHGSPAAVLTQSITTLSASMENETALRLHEARDSERVQAALRWLEQPDNHLMTLADEDYPALLLESGDPPCVLYLKGRRELIASPCLAVVGSRNPTPQGSKNAEHFARSLSDAGFTIVSGLALGIDAAAHRGALGGRSASIAVVGTGLDIVYPARNRDLAHQLAQNGLLISEFPLGTPGLAGNFPRRNRIISGLSRGCLVVEAAIASGSLITARLAGEQGRDIFAIPGSIHSPLSKGCHLLIKQGAKLVESADDVLSELGFEPVAAARSTASARSETPQQAASLLDAMGHDPVTIDELSERVEQAAGQIQAALLELELSGHVGAMPGGKYQRLG